MFGRVIRGRWRKRRPPSPNSITFDTTRPPLWSSGQTSWLQTHSSRVWSPALPDFSEYQWVWNGVHSAFVRINEELLERKSSGSGLGN
jgi:hypothetical protein